MTARWRSDRDCLELLERDGPFASRVYRDALAPDGWRDVSFGAIAADGARAAVALVARDGAAQSMPFGYGGVVCEAPLADADARGFLAAARRAAGVPVVTAWSLGAFGGRCDTGGARIAGSLVVTFADATSPTSGYAKKARQSMRRAERAGGTVESGSDPEPFLALYEPASEGWSMQYPRELIRRLARAGALRFFDARLDGTVAASAVALVGIDHWFYWLSAQNEAGRQSEVGYLTLGALIETAHAAGVAGVNLGASEGLPGVAAFKRRFGGVEVPVRARRSATTPAAVVHALGTAAGRMRSFVERRVRSA